MYRTGILIAACLMLLSGPAWAVSVAEPDGEALYNAHCAKCHDSVARAPKLGVMRKLPPEFIMRSLEVGRMVFQGVMRTKVERLAIAAYISEKDFGAARDDQAASWTYCSLLPGQLDLSEQTANWNGWGGGISNARFQPADKAGLSAADIPNLKLKWSFGLPENYQTSQPTVFGGRIYIGSMRGVVFSLNATTGCLYWVSCDRGRGALNRDGRTDTGQRPTALRGLFRRCGAKRVCARRPDRRADLENPDRAASDRSDHRQPGPARQPPVRWHGLV